MQEPHPRVLKSGVYLLNNQKGGTAADLSGGDRRSLIGTPFPPMDPTIRHNNTNEQGFLCIAALTNKYCLFH